jgi:hypothetical protein
MAEINQYTVTLRELVETLIKTNHLHEGQWTLLLGFQVAGGNFGPSPDQTFPGMAVSINHLGLQRVLPGQPTTGPGIIVVDAAKVNPKPKVKSKK